MVSPLMKYKPKHWESPIFQKSTQATDKMCTPITVLVHKLSLNHLKEMQIQNPDEFGGNESLQNYLRATCTISESAKLTVPDVTSKLKRYLKKATELTTFPRLKYESRRVTNYFLCGAMYLTP